MPDSSRVAGNGSAEPAVGSSVGTGLRNPKIAVTEEERASRDDESRVKQAPWRDTLFICVLILGWYGFNVLYNIDNKKALNLIDLPLTVTACQLSFGWVIFLPYWYSHPLPVYNSFEVFAKKIGPQGIFHFAGHLFNVISLGLGAVSFTHVVKACEPAVVSLFVALFLKKYHSACTYLTLAPIIGGVAIASANEITFTWMSFGFAMLSNVFSAARAIYAKSALTNRHQLGTNMEPINIFASLTTVAMVPAIVCALCIEGPRWTSSWEDATMNGKVQGTTVVIRVFRSALWYVSYNLLSFRVLEILDQITHAVANALKRVVVIVFAVFVFGTPVAPAGAAGTLLAIFGTFLYSQSLNKKAATSPPEGHV